MNPRHQQDVTEAGTVESFTQPICESLWRYDELVLAEKLFDSVLIATNHCPMKSI